MNRDSDDIVSLISERALYLEERYKQDLSNGRLPNSIELHHILLWQEALGSAKGCLNRRLSLFKDKLETQDSHEWVPVLSEVLKNYKTTVINIALQEDCSSPYELFLTPFFDWFKGELKARDVFGKPETNKAEPYFIAQIKLIIVRISQDCFHQFYLDSNKNGVCNDLNHYANFFFSGGYSTFYKRYAILGRIIIEILVEWIEKIEFFISSFSSNQARLADMTDVTGPLFIESIKILSATGVAGIGHNTLVSLSNGQKLLFKPKSALGDEIYLSLVSWFNEQNELIELKGYKILNCKDHHWCSYVDQVEIVNTGGIEHFYKSIGVLQALTQVLCSRDYHFENLIADGAYPILTDHESICASLVQKIRSQNIYGDSFLNEGLSYSAATSGLTTHYLSSIYPSPPSINSLFYAEEAYVDLNYFINKKRQPQKAVITKLRVGKNIPDYKGGAIDINDQIPLVLEGYEYGLNIIKANVDSFYEVLSDSSNMWSGYMRILLRPSGLYAKYLRESFQAEYMTDGITRSIYFEELFRYYYDSELNDQDYYLLNHEISALKSCSIPKFHCEMNTSKSKLFPSITFGETSARDNVLRQMDAITKPGKIDNWINQYQLLLHVNFDKPRSLEAYIRIVIDKLSLSYQYFGARDFNSREEILEYYDLEKGLGGIIPMYLAAAAYYEEDSYIDEANRFANPLISVFSQLDFDKTIRTGYSYLNYCKKLGLNLEALRTLESHEINRSMIDLATIASFSVDQLINKIESTETDSIVNGKAGVVEQLIKLSPTTEEYARLIQIIYKDLSIKGKFDCSPKYHDLSFLNGISGIVFQYLRLLSKGSIPSLIEFTQHDQNDL